jgi:pimeloyl-ACP methyl ester carboxylesterase
MRHKMTSLVWVMIFILIAVAASAQDNSANCVPERQDNDSEYLICRAPEWNGSLVIWAHGFQDAGTPVGIPEDQLLVGDDIYIPAIVTGLGFDFVTHRYSKTGLAIFQGSADILELVDTYKKKNSEIGQGPPKNVYLIGASEGGIITALLVEKHPDVFRAGLALCGPVGDFPYQINYFGDARVTFEYFFPGVLPKLSCSENQYPIRDWCNLAKDPTENWSQCFDEKISPVLFDRSNRGKLDQWVRVAGIAYDPANYLDSVAESARDVLRYSMLNLEDAVATLDGFPFDNKRKWYSGSKKDLWLNLLVKRCSADADALLEMKTNYNTSGALQHPLITMHTLRDQQIPYIHEILYDWKTFFQGSLLTKHINIPVDRYGHCNFTLEEALLSFGLMLLYSGDLQLLAGVGTILQGTQLEAFEQMAVEYGLPYTQDGSRLKTLLK